MYCWAKSTEMKVLITLIVSRNITKWKFWDNKGMKSNTFTDTFVWESLVAHDNVKEIRKFLRTFYLSKFLYFIRTRILVSSIQFQWFQAAKLYGKLLAQTAPSFEFINFSGRLIRRKFSVQLYICYRSPLVFFGRNFKCNLSCYVVPKFKCILVRIKMRSSSTYNSSSYWWRIFKK